MTNRTLEESKIVKELSPWNANENVVWIASTLEIKRNIEKFKFPAKLEKERKKHLLSLMMKEFSTSEKLKKVSVIKEEDLSSIEKNFFLEHFLIIEGVHPDNTGDSAVVFDESGTFAALLNFKNHIQCYALDTHGDLEGAWTRLVAIERDLEKAFNFAFSEKFGYLTADPLSCGTALVATAYLHLPALIHTGKLTEVIGNDKNEAVLVSGLQGDPEDRMGDILTVRNRYALGVNEENIINTLRNSVLHFVLNEKNSRSMLSGEQKDVLKDKISKALGLVKYSYRLDHKEALNQLSLIKLGIELGYIKGMTIGEVNTLLFSCRSAHLSYLSGTSFTGDESQSFRAEHLRRKVQNLTFE
jgi:protein arginine kinase